MKPEYQENRDLYPQGLKRCPKCKEVKMLVEFSKKSSTWDGLRSNCKDCDKVYHDEYRSRPENVQKEKSTHKVWLENNHERVYTKGREWDKKNQEKRQRLRREWHLANKESENAISRKRMLQWVKDNPERHKANTHRRRARELGAEGSYTDDQLKHLLAFFKGKCPCCGKRRKLTIDHIIPLKWGGTNFINNLQPLCKPCNCAKGDRHATDYRPDAAKQWASSQMVVDSLQTTDI